jgi:hypothetical protein
VPKNNALTPARPAVGLDVGGTIKNMGEMVVRRALEPRCQNLPLWDKGLGDVVGAIVDQCNLPKQVTALDVGRALGLIRKGRR